MAVLSVRDLTKRYGARTVVDTLAFDVPEGTVFGLLGPNGAGKTTTIRLALGLVRPAAGTVEILGRRLGSRDYHRSLHQVGSLIEGPALYKALSGKRNLEVHARYLGLDGADRRIGGVAVVHDEARRRRGNGCRGVDEEGECEGTDCDDGESSQGLHVEAPLRSETRIPARRVRRRHLDRGARDGSDEACEGGVDGKKYQTS